MTKENTTMKNLTGLPDRNDAYATIKVVQKKFDIDWSKVDSVEKIVAVL